MRLLSRILVMLLLTTSVYSCVKKPDLKSIAEKIEEKTLEDLTRERQEEVFNKLPLLTVNELRDTVIKLAEDKQDANEYKQLTMQQLALKKLGAECVTCNPEAEDPNVR